MIRLRSSSSDAIAPLRVSIFAFAALAAFAGCHDGSAPPASAGGDTSPPSPTAMTTATPGGSASVTPADGKSGVVHLEDDGKSFDLARGATLTVSLPSNAGTGYLWTPTKIDTGVLAQQGDRTVENSSPGLPGAATSDVYRFTAASAG